MAVPRSQVEVRPPLVGCPQGPNISCAPVSGAAIHGHTTAVEGTIICQHQPKQTLEGFLMVLN